MSVRVETGETVGFSVPLADQLLLHVDQVESEQLLLGMANGGTKPPACAVDTRGPAGV